MVGVLPFLRAGPRTGAEVAAHAGLPVDGAERLLLAATALGLAERLDAGGAARRSTADDPVGSRFALGADGAALLGNPGVVEMIAHHRFLYADLGDPVALLRRRGGSLAGYWAYGAADGADGAGRVAAYSALMAASQPGIAAAVLDADLVARHRRLLDIADPRLARVGGSFVDDRLPDGADLIALVRVVHDHDDAVVAALLARVAGVLPPGGTLLVAEPMAETRGAEPIGDAYFGVYLWAMGSGRPRSAARLTTMLAAAGLGRVREHPTAIPALVRVLTAIKDG